MPAGADSELIPAATAAFDPLPPLKLPVTEVVPVVSVVNVIPAMPLSNIEVVPEPLLIRLPALKERASLTVMPPEISNVPDPETVALCCPVLNR